MVATWSIAADSAYYSREAAGEKRGSYYASGKEPAGKWYAPKGDFSLIDGENVDSNLFQRLYAGIEQKRQFAASPGARSRSANQSRLTTALCPLLAPSASFGRTPAPTCAG